MIKVMNTISSIFPQKHCIVMMAGKNVLIKVSNESGSQTTFKFIFVQIFENSGCFCMYEAIVLLNKLDSDA